MSTLSGGTRLINATLYALVGLSLMVTGCSSTSKIAHNAKGSVALEEIMDWSFEASHPAIIDQTTILKIVKGVYFAEDQNGSRMSAAGSKPMRVFSDEDAEFLAPLLAQGLSKAKPEQLVVFRVSSSAGSGSEPTAGSIYVQQSAIHFTISKGAGATTFVPESAARAEQAPPYAAGGRAGVIAQVIDYHALAKASLPDGAAGREDSHSPSHRFENGGARSHGDVRGSGAGGIASAAQSEPKTCSPRRRRKSRCSAKSPTG